jgi:predicted Zn-dependent peptidase
LWEGLLYGDQPAGWSVAGEKGIIKKIKRGDFIHYLNNHYSSHNTVIAIAGNINKIDELKNKIKKYFGKINISQPKSKITALEKQNKPQILIHEKKTDQTHLYIGFRAFNMFHKDKYVLDVLGAVLGGGMSSRMWISVREQKGLAYYVRSNDMLYSDVGYYATQAGVDNNRVEDAIKVILDEYKLIRDKKINSKELRKAKDMIKGRAILSMESSSVQTKFYAEQELFENKILTLEQIFAKIEAVTAEDIQRVARDIFKPEKLNLALIGPFKDKTKFQKLLKL